MYRIAKNCALWVVYIKGSTVVQFSSLSRARCGDWVKANSKELS